MSQPCQCNQEEWKRVFVKQLICSEFNYRCQVDGIDFRNLGYFFKHLTKSVALNPLRIKTAEGLSYGFKEIFAAIGGPSTQQSDNGMQFVSNSVSGLIQCWPKLKNWATKVPPPSGQGSDETANKNFNLCTMRKIEIRTLDWKPMIMGVKFIYSGSRILVSVRRKKD